MPDRALAAIGGALGRFALTRAEVDAWEAPLRTGGFDVCLVVVGGALEPERAAQVAAVAAEAGTSVLALDAMPEGAAGLPAGRFAAVLPVAADGAEALLSASVAALVAQLGRAGRAPDRTGHRPAGERYGMLRALVESSPLATIGLDEDGRISTWNPAAERLYGFSAAQVAGKPLAFLDAPAGTGHGAAEGDVVQRRSDGQLLSVRLWTSLLRDAAGESAGAVVLAEDVTALRALEERSRHAQRLEAAGRLAGGIAHDFNNLLTVILGLGEVLAEDPSISASARADVAEVRAAAERAAALTRQLLAVSSRQLLRPVLLDLNDLVAGMRGLLSSAVGDRIELRIQSRTDRAVVRADGSQLERALLNLAVNARDAMPHGGVLELCTSAAPPDRDWPDGSVVLTVEDTGCGMNAETLQHVFEPFFTTKQRGKGTGLGLATVYGIVQQSGGHVAVESVLGKGSRFTLALPSAAHEAGAAAPSAEGSRAPRAGQTVLVVEDEAVVRRLVTRVLRDAGYEVLEAFGGASALQLARAHAARLNLLVVDVVMPGMNGRETAERIAKLRPGLPTLFISGYTDEIIAPHGVLEPGVQLLPKPFAARELLWRVQQLLKT